MREAAVRGPMPQSISITPPGQRSTLQFPEDPLARMEMEGDIRVVFGTLKITLHLC
jgi:hypothetical protein